jgi:uncharacterized protein YggE
LGVADKDISTDYYLIQPVYQNYDSLDIKGYRIHNTIVANIKDVGKVSQALTAALTGGANEVVDVQFKTTQLRRYRDQARELAVKAAQEKARDLASTARLSLHARVTRLVRFFGAAQDDVCLNWTVTIIPVSRNGSQIRSISY